MPVVTRQVGPDDWADWRSLRQRSLTEDPQAFASSVSMWTGDNDTEARWRERLADGPCFVAYDGDTPVGMVAGQAAGDEAELISMWVAPEARRQGVGAQLIAGVVRWASVRRLSLRVIDGNTAAVRAYEAAGFVLQGGVDDEGCCRMVRTAPPYRLVRPAVQDRLTDRFFARFRRVGLRGVLADLNRAGVHATVPAEAAKYGMQWQRDDQASARWFPQGITTSADAYGPDPSGGMFEGHDVVMASWYGKGWLGRRLGSRVSVVDWHDDTAPRYRHVLLVDPQRRWGFHRLRPVKTHAGGIVWYGDHLFVAGSSKGVRVFRLDDIVRVGAGNRLRTGGYRYVLPQLTVYTAEHDGDAGPMTYSFMSLDRAGAEDHLVAGEYGRKGGSHRLIRYAIDRDTGLLRSDEQGRAVPTDLHDRQVARMQGAVIADGTWVVTSSNGEGLPGDLWVGAPGEFTRHRGVLPTGAEDITYLPQRRELWSLTEWPGHRWVYSIDADRYLPPRDDTPRETTPLNGRTS